MQRGRSRIRPAGAILVVLGCLLVPLAVTAVWLRAEVFDTGAYVRTVAPLSSNPSIDDAVAATVTAELFAHVDVSAEARRVLPANVGFMVSPLVAGVRDYTRSTVESFLGSSRFRSVWVGANRTAHAELVAVLLGQRTVFVGGNGAVTIDLQPAAGLIRSQLEGAGLEVFKRVPASLLDRRLVLVRSRSLGQVRLGVVVLRRVAIGLPLLAAVLLLLGFLVSPARRRLLGLAGASVAGAAALALAGLVIGRSYYLDHVSGLGLPRPAAAAFYDTVVRGLDFEFRLVLAAGLAILVAALLAGPAPVAARIRTVALATVGRFADEAIGESARLDWVAANRADLRAVVVVAGGLVIATSAHLSGAVLIEDVIGMSLALAGIEVLSRPTSRPGASQTNPRGVP